MKKILALVIVTLLALSMVSAFAAPDALPTKGTLTINNAGIGETYTIYKVLDAQVGANGAIVYPGPVPTGLEDCFELLGETGNLKVKVGLSDVDLFAKLKTWAATATETAHQTASTATVTFDDVPFGYYVVVSTMDNGAVISVTSTNPDAVTYEKNVTVPQPDKTVDGHHYSIGDEIEYTVTFNGANYMGGGENAQIVTKYEISDTLPNFLSDAHVKSITIGEGASAVSITDKDFVNKKFDIEWATKGTGDHDWTSKYPNGTKVTIVYTATLTDVVHVGADNINTVTVQPYVDKPNGPGPWEEHWSDDEKVQTFATAIKKVDAVTGKPLAGAKFTVKGLNVTKTSDGVYTVVSYDASSDTQSMEMEVDANGMLYIIGLKENLDLVVTETKAPTGYNKLAAPVTIQSQIQSSESYKIEGYRKYDEKGNIIEEAETMTGGTAVHKNLSELDAAAVTVENGQGTELPSTGGIGTTLFYVGGGILVLAAIILLVTKRRMNAND